MVVSGYPKSRFISYSSMSFRGKSENLDEVVESKWNTDSLLRNTMQP